MSNRRGGTSFGESIVLSQDANRLTMPSRRAHVARCTSLGSIAHLRASSEVMNSAPTLQEFQKVAERHGRFLELRAEGSSKRHIFTRASRSALIGHP